MSISVTDPIGAALRRTGQVLFRPFHLGKWMAIALGASLWLLGEGGSGFPNFNTGGGGGRGGGPGGPPPDLGKMIQDGWNWVLANLHWLIPAAVVVILFLMAVYLVVRWLSARGTFMFFDNIVNNDDRVKAPWADFRELGNSLFRFRIWWDLLWFNVWLILVVLVGALIWPDVKAFIITDHYPLTGWTIWAIVVLALGLLGLAVVHWFLRGLVFRLAVPVMFIRRMQAWPAVKVAWRELFLPHKGVCLLYFLFLIVVAIVRGIWAMAALVILGLVTCCIGFFLMAIPFVGSYIVALTSLPVLVFDRAYCLHFIAQFGPEYQMAWQMPAVGGFPVVMDSAPPPPGPPGA